MTTPTDPYNSASRRPFDDDEVLAPLEGDASADAEKSGPSYGDSDLFAWDQAFSAQSASVAEDLSNDDAPALDESSHADILAGENSVEVISEGESTPSETKTFESIDESKDFDQPTNDASQAATGYNSLPNEDRKNATLFDVASAHSADEADDASRPSRTHALNRDESFASALSPDDATTSTASAGTGFAAGGMAVAAATEASYANDRIGVASDEDDQRNGFMNGVTPDDDQRARWSTDPGEDAYVDVPEEPKSRIGAHFGAFFATLLLLPLAWYLVSDAGVRLGMVKNNPWETGSLNFLAVGELLAGLIVLLVIFLLARASSIGAHVIGGLLAIAGFVAIIVPAQGARFATAVDDAIGSYNAFTGNVAHHLNLDLGTGRIAVLGFVLLLAGIVAHGARRRGAVRATAVTRREFLVKDADAPAN
ncbi:hypothetical protein [Arcanobacterium ihumii]|uniref:hypothetical protein n=1 Tax=Arcanobacterium ihumii TaxID=2138162 RepID=UPI000F526091|nr:hypothetical protein [Arcanobacterium ihumii]